MATALGDKAMELPPGWETVVSDGGTQTVYYWNRVTNETTWDKPARTLLTGNVGEEQQNEVVSKAQEDRLAQKVETAALTKTLGDQVLLLPRLGSGGVGAWHTVLVLLESCHK